MKGRRWDKPKTRHPRCLCQEVPKEIIDRRIQDIFTGLNKGRKADHYLVVWEGYPLKKYYPWEPIENLYGQEDLPQTYEQ